MSALSVRVLDVPLIQQIIEEAIELLWDPGVKVNNLEALEILASSGAFIDKENKIASIPHNLVLSSLETVPSEFFLYSLDSRPVIHYGSKNTYFDPGSTALTFYSWEEKNQIVPKSSDFIKFIKIVELLDDIDAHSTAMICGDVVAEIGDLYRLYLALNYINKPIITGAFRKDTFWIMHDMLAVVAGNSDNLRKFPLAIFDICPSPPLTWSDLTCQNLIDCAKTGIPAQLVSMPLAGATAPVTLAGAVVQHAAESLSGIVIHQSTNPGSPIVWGGSPAAVDMRHGTTPMGAPGTWLINSANVQVAKHLNLPTHVYMGMSDAKIIDAQCGMESMGGTMAAILAGPNMVSGAGMLDFETCQSIEKLIIDAEIIGMCKHFINGITKRETPMGLNIIREVGHKGDFLITRHTREWFTKELYLPSELIDRGSFSTWEEGGGKSIADRAHDRSVQLLNNYADRNPLSREARNELRQITLAAARQFGMSELPDLSLE